MFSTHMALKIPFTLPAQHWWSTVEHLDQAYSTTFLEGPTDQTFTLSMAEMYD